MTEPGKVEFNKDLKMLVRKQMRKEKKNNLYIKKTRTKKITGTEFLLRLSKFKAKGLPKDLAKNHDKYLWKEYRSS